MLKASITSSNSSCNPVYLGYNKISGLKVAIKVMENSKYQRLSFENQISESNAM